MRRILAAVLCLVMLAGVSAALAEDVSLPVRMEKQLQHDGNGLKGSFTLSANAGEDHALLQALQNAEYSLLRNASGSDRHLVLFQTPADDPDTQKNRAEFYRTDAGLFFRTDFLPEKVFRMPDREALLGAVLSARGENPSIIPAMAGMMSMSENDRKRWEPVTAKYGKMLEIWLGGFAADLEMTYAEDGTTLMRRTFIVPAEEVGKEIIELVRTAYADPAVTDLFKGVLTEEEAAIYLNPSLIPYYEAALKSFHFTGEVRFSQTVTAMGEVLSTELFLPLDPALTGYISAEIATAGGQITWTLRSEEEILRVSMPEKPEEALAEPECKATVRYLRVYTDAAKKAENRSVVIEIRKTTVTRTDEEDGRLHEIQRYTVRASRDADGLPEGVAADDIAPFETAEILAELHYSGMPGSNRAVKLEITAEAEQGELRASVQGTLKTGSTWAFVPFEIKDPTEWTGMSEADREAGIRQLAEAAKQAVIRIAETEETEEETAE